MKTFASGAKRSKEMPRFDLLSRDLLERTAATWKEGADKYGEYNWQKGGPDFVKDIPNHIINHIFAYVAGDTSEDHLSHIVCNVQMLMHFGKK